MLFTSVHKNMSFSALAGQCILHSVVSPANTKQLVLSVKTRLPMIIKTIHFNARSRNACRLERTMGFATHRPSRYISLRKTTKQQ